MRNERSTAILFDLDGTLIDSIELLLASVRHAFRARPGRVPTESEWVAGIGTPLAAQLRPFAESEQELDTLVAAYREYQHAHHDRLTRCFDDVLDTVRLLDARGHPMAVVTSKADAIARRSLDYVGLAPYMDVVVGCDSCVRHKPDPEPVLLALERLGFSRSEAVFVGDSPHDVLAGNAAGVTTVAALWGPFTRAQLEATRPGHFLDRIRDLPPLLDALQGTRHS